MIYPEMQMDFFPKLWNSIEYESQLNILLDENSYLAATEEGFIRLSLMEKIGQIVKGLLGGTNYTTENRIQAAWLKFLYYGEVQGFLKDEQRERLQWKIQYSSQTTHPAIKRLFNQINDYHLNWNKTSEVEHFKQLRATITDYQQRYASSLRPGFWSRLFIRPCLNSKKLEDFGDTYWYLSKQALEQEKPNSLLALTHLRKAFVIRNDSPQFQKKLAEQLQTLETTYSTNLQDQQEAIQDLWIALAKTSFKNRQTNQANIYLEKALKAHPSHLMKRQEIGKIYLMNKQYQLVQPFLTEIQAACQHDFQLQIEIGNAYWHAAKYQEAALAYDKVLSAYQKSTKSSSSKDKEMAFIHNRLGTAYLQNLIPSNFNHLSKAISLFAHAVKSDSTVLDYKKNLTQAYVQQWQASPRNFASSYGLDLLNFLAICESDAIDQWTKEIKKMLLSCSEQFFQAHQNKKAHACLEKMFDLFPNEVNLKIEALDVATRYNDWKPLEKDFDDWEDEYYANPYLKKKIADAYWDSDRDLALDTYREALDLLNHRLPLCQGPELDTCQRHIAEIQIKIGKNQLNVQSGLFKSIPYDDALQRLEEAARLNPEYASSLFDAYLAAAQAEKQRNKLLRDTQKIISYYQKAFQTLLEKGEYLVELLELCLDSKRHDDAVKIYYDIQKQPWSQQFILPAEVFSRLAEHLFKQKDYEHALACLKQAYKQEPKNKDYKEDYFQLPLTLAQDSYKKIQEDKEKESHITHLVKVSQMLTDCWNEGFQKVEKFRKPYQDILAKIHESLAEIYVQRCWLPLPASEYSSSFEKEVVKKHKKQHQEDIQQALHYYDEALRYQPNNAALHFDKGLLLDWNTHFDEAAVEIELAVKYQPRNPFYHKMLAMLYFAVKGCSPDEHMELAEKCAPPHFAQDYPIWRDEYMCSQKTKLINPHSYTTKSNWF